MPKSRIGALPRIQQLWDHGRHEGLGLGVTVRGYGYGVFILVNESESENKKTKNIRKRKKMQMGDPPVLKNRCRFNGSPGSSRFNLLATFFDSFI